MKARKAEKKEADSLAPFASFCTTRSSRGNKETHSHILEFLTAGNHRQLCARFLFAMCFRSDAKGGKQK